VFIGAAGNRAVVRPLKSRRTLKLLQLSGITKGRKEVRGTGNHGKKSLDETRRQKTRHTLQIEELRKPSKFQTVGSS